MDQYYIDLIANEYRNCVRNTISRISQNERTYRPFHSALLSDDVIFWSGFERSFSTSFGQRVVEELAKIVALANGAEKAQRQVETQINIDEGYQLAITKHIESLRSGNRYTNYDWNSSLNEVLNAQLTGKITTRRVISDFWWYKNGINHYISLKTVKPNIDQTSVAKEDCLYLTIGDRNCKAYFGLPYNPYGERKEDYAFNPPMRIFDFHYDSVVLIGREMWDTIGGSGCYDILIDIAKQVGYETRKEIATMGRF